MPPIRPLTPLIVLALAVASGHALADEPVANPAPAKGAVTAEPPTASDAEPEESDEPEGLADEPEPAWERAPVERRGGFTMGASIGLGLGAANGYPADARKIGLERYYTETGLGLSTASSVWLGGALSDWVNFGAGMGFANLLADGSKSPAPTVFFHLDVFPLYDVDESLRDLGLVTEAGLAFAQTVDDASGDELIQAPGASYVSVGAFWEGLELWKLRSGPMLAGHWVFSDTLRRPSVLAGFRTAFYWDP